ncbi:maleylpyruvate isomerase family mycothiol-dependent enzyme [Mycobacterium paragordonae]|uniref:Maleylpyruvate isomerase family mycothiol-dependent enzyme n=1 Tax=Mycobacterium paragordonae TaxID=1389713 RepID=A0A4V3AXR4_9MYCO|nr:maleylpyruvate isomerase family mycothiol-dependent enzyme [Mycobacterium paragordonae]MDP7736348.1 maleylpyruvate isomerase family mycothiol-dependent enzyme [Mycobacterium paragordonae]TDK97004.1 maleylpyruvate isomerase family mycothiol-dependent enzyme [Mycobacterium paragordonae]TDK99539.1 maleylpyruvate isomerase family mycothiol-dependent enzyme [Mycobacterium paragordonae]TDL06109.1 maleylpyruvate isomerase family mycothiol-dependent enzyme [Mycobacterium paragordonae]
MADRPVTLLDKSDVLTGLFAVWDDLDALLDGLSEADWQTPSALAGWDVKAVVSHIIGTESFLQGASPPEPDIDVKALDHVRNDIGVMNECWVRHLGGEPGAQVLEKFREVTGTRRKVLEAMSDDEWNAVSFTPAGPDSYGRFMRIRVFDCWMHEQDIRIGLQRPSSDGELLGPALRLSLDEVETSMGFVVGKLAKAPEGSRVLFDLTGPAAREIRVSVDGRAQLVADFGGAEPTATIRVDALQFTRLAGGRPLCPARSQNVELEGDRDVAGRIVERINFVI